VEKAELRRLQHSGEKRRANNLLQSKRFDGDAADRPTGSKAGEKIAFEQTPKVRALGNRDLQDRSAENELASAANVEACVSNLKLFHVERYQHWCLFVDFRWASAVTIGPRVGITTAVGLADCTGSCGGERKIREIALISRFPGRP